MQQPDIRHMHVVMHHNLCLKHNPTAEAEEPWFFLRHIVVAAADEQTPHAVSNHHLVSNTLLNTLPTWLLNSSQTAA
jgi:hypothetical protein